MGLLNSLPVNKKVVFIIKAIFNYLILLPNYILCIFFIWKSVNVYVPYLTVAVLFTGLLTVFIKIYIDFLSPVLNWQHERQMFDNKRKYLIWFIIIIVSIPNLFIINFEIISSIILMMCIQTILTFLCLLFYKRKLLKI